MKIIISTANVSNLDESFGSYDWPTDIPLVLPHSGDIIRIADGQFGIVKSRYFNYTAHGLTVELQVEEIGDNAMLKQQGKSHFR